MKLLLAILLTLVLVSPATASAPYHQEPSCCVWDSYPLASTHEGTEFRLTVWSIFKTPTINGIFDNNIALMTKKGRDAIKTKDFSHYRTVVDYGTSPQDLQLRMSMREANRYGWTILLAINVKQPAPKQGAYKLWLASILRAYPRISVIEATNEPDCKLTVNQAVKYYRAAREFRKTLAGGFTDGCLKEDYLVEYASKARASDYALHPYMAVWHNNLQSFKSTITKLGAKHVWVTEIAAMEAYGDENFTLLQTANQMERIVKMSKWPIIERVYQTGWQSCNGCQPTVTR